MSQQQQNITTLLIPDPNGESRVTLLIILFVFRLISCAGAAHEIFYLYFFLPIVSLCLLLSVIGLDRF